MRTSEPRLYVLDGRKALHKAVTDVFGKSAVIQRCQVHKKRNVLAHLPESEQIRISIALTMHTASLNTPTPSLRWSIY